MSPSRLTISPTAACLAFAVMSTWSLPVPGQVPIEMPPVYRTWKSFTTRDGLPHDSIRAIRIVDGNVWVGTEGGLALYDGRTWKSWTQDDGLTVPGVTAIEVDIRTGELWLGTWGGGLFRFSAGRFDRFDQMNSGLAGNLVLAVCVAGGRIWAATNAGLSSFDPVNDTWDLHFARRADTPETALTSLSVDGNHLYAAGWDGSVRRLDLHRGEWASVSRLGNGQLTQSSGAGRFGRPALGIASVERSLWLLTQERLFRRLGTNAWEARSIGVASEGTDFVRCLAVRSQSEVWVGTNNGLHRLADWSSDTWLTYRRCENGDTGLVTVTRGGQPAATRMVNSTIPDNRIRCIAFAQDTVWVGTVNGLARGSDRKRWSDLPVPAEGVTTACPQPATAVSATSEERGGSAPEAVTIAVLGPIVMSIVLPGDDLRESNGMNRADPLAVQLAVDEANAWGGYRGRVPFLLATGVGGYERYGWGTPDDDFATFLYRDHALGVVAYVGPGHVIRSAVAFRSELPLVNGADSPPSVDEELNPWIFRCPGDDPRHHERLVDHIFDHMGCRRPAILRTPGVMARRHLDLWSRYVRKRCPTDGGLVAEVDYDPDSDDLGERLETLRRSEADAVLTWCDVPVSARVLREMRKAGMAQLFVGSDQIVCKEFAKLAGRRAGPVIAPYPCPHRKNRAAVARFVEGYTAQNSPAQQPRPPAPDAYLAYHAMSHLLQAVNIAGLDREALRRTLVRMSETSAAVLKEGRWERVTLPDR